MTIPLETRGLAVGWRRRRGDVVLARDMTLQLRRGRLVGLLGVNGAGKSTLLRTLAGMMSPLAGAIRIGGMDTARLSPQDMARRLCIVLTTPPEPSLLNGYALAALGRYPHSDWLGRLTKRDHAQVKWALEAVDASDLGARRVSELSDGQRQKLMIARALAQDCPLMLLDEPTAYLDYPRRVETLRLLRRLTREANRAILVATHELDLALRICDELWLMSGARVIVGGPQMLAEDGSLQAAFGMKELPMMTALAGMGALESK